MPAQACSHTPQPVHPSASLQQAANNTICETEHVCKCAKIGSELWGNPQSRLMRLALPSKGSQGRIRINRHLQGFTKSLHFQGGRLPGILHKGMVQKPSCIPVSTVQMQLGKCRQGRTQRHSSSRAWQSVANTDRGSW